MSIEFYYSKREEPKPLISKHTQQKHDNTQHRHTRNKVTFGFDWEQLQFCVHAQTTFGFSVALSSKNTFRWVDTLTASRRSDCHVLTL